MSRRTALSVGAALAALSLVPTAQAATSCGTFSGAGGDVLRVYALQGVSCKQAKSVARVVAQYPAPAPWHCLTGTGQKYKRKPVSFACGYGSGGPVMKRKHAFVAVQTHSAG